MKQYKENEIIITEGEETGYLYKVVSGKVGLYNHYKEKDEYLIGILSDQRYFGEVGFLAGSTSPYTVVAEADCLIMEISHEDFDDFIVRNTKNAIDIMVNLAKTVNTLNHHMDLISQELVFNLEKGKGTPLDIKEKLLAYKRWG